MFLFPRQPRSAARRELEQLSRARAEEERRRHAALAPQPQRTVAAQPSLASSPKRA
jgi:hypothetical protein